MAVLFLSDLHLDATRPDAVHRFVDLMQVEARSADRVYILGDLFEVWLGDDDDDETLLPIRAAITELTTAGVPCFFMHGNRDFLIGASFAEETGIQLLGEFEVVELFGEPVLLTHGDLLCTDDTRYMTLREQLRNPNWQRNFLSKSLAERRRMAAELRELSQTEMAEKAQEIMDVNDASVRDTMRRFEVQSLIHGHTHRPAIHSFELDGDSARRIVLADWYQTGGYLVWSEAGPVEHSF